MSPHRPVILFHSLHPKQRGAVLMVMLVIIVIGSATFLVNAMSRASLQIEREQITSDALARAKEALISYAISSEKTGTNTARPGNFPCPDTTAPGLIGYGDAQGTCSSGGGTSIGRLPWKTLGIPESTDVDGEPLWYVLSDNFRTSSPIINSDTKGTLLVYDRDGTTLLTTTGSEAVAIIFAAGSTIGTQQRVTNANKTTASNYLETSNGRNNASAGGPFIAADKNDSINDRLIIIRTRDFIPTIEKRVAKELSKILDNYRTTYGFYPYPASFNSCKDATSCDSDPTICRGNFPYNALPTNWGATIPLSLPKAGLSSWFIDNKWYRVIYFSAATNRLATTPIGCSAALNVSGNSVPVPGLLLMPGTPLSNIVRSYGVPPKNLTMYLEDALNNDNLDDNYTTPTSISNDQLYVLP